MQDSPLSLSRSICDRDPDHVFSSDLIARNEPECDHPFIEVSDDNDFEPIPIMDYTRDPMCDHRFQSNIQMQQGQAPQGTPYVRQVSPATGGVVLPHCEIALQRSIMMQLGQSPYGSASSYFFHQGIERHVNTERFDADYPFCDTILSSPHVVSMPSSPATAQESTATDIMVLQTMQEEVPTPTRRRNKKQSKDVMLPEDFVPGPYTVIIDRRKRARQATGNQRLRMIAMSFLNEYAEALKDKLSKSRIVTTIWRMFEDVCPDGGAFVRVGTDGRWYKVQDAVATEKVGYTMRELLGERYRSSSTGKKMARLQSFVRDDSSRSEYEV